MSEVLFSYRDIGVSMLAPRIVVSPRITEPCEDFSACRSPSRARRRWRKRGIQGHAIFARPARKAFHDTKSNTIYMHPEMAAKMRRELKRRADRMASEFFIGACVVGGGE